jgi:hypothetical protein
VAKTISGRVRNPGQFDLVPGTMALWSGRDGRFGEAANHGLDRYGPMINQHLTHRTKQFDHPHFYEAVHAAVARLLTEGGKPRGGGDSLRVLQLLPHSGQLAGHASHGRWDQGSHLGVG